MNKLLLSVLLFTQLVMAESDIASQNDLSAITASTNGFALSLQKALSEGKQGNLFCSPLSLQLAIGMVAAGAGENSASYNELKQLFSFPDDRSKMLSSYSVLANTLKSSDVLKIANKIFIDKKFSVKKEYLDETKKYFNSDAKQVDFKQNAAGATKEINTWVEQQTNNKIRDLFASNSLTPLTAMVLVNAIHFKADWKYAFKTANTEKKPFYLDDVNNVDVDMMHITEKYRLLQDINLKAKILEMPYKNDDFSMVFVLPDSKTGLAELEATMNSKTFDLTGLLNRVQNSGPVKTIVSIPKFEMTQTHDLIEVLQKLGVNEIFDEERANFSRIVADPKYPIFVSKVIQKAFVSVDEKGTEAAAATAQVTRKKRSLIEEQEFIADHPFLFIISNRSNCLSNFVGRYMPSSDEGRGSSLSDHEDAHVEL